MYMFKYILKRLGLMLLTFAVIMIMCFVLIKLLPIVVTIKQGDDVELIYTKLQERGYICNVIKNEDGVYTYDTVPVMIQFWNYLRRIFV